MIRFYKFFFPILIFVVFFSLLGLGIYYRFIAPQPAIQEMKPVKLVWWRVFDDEDSMADIINGYHELHSNVTIDYRKLRYNEYEQALLEAMAEDRGPDILSIHNTWIRKYANRLYPLPASLTLPYQTVKGSIKKETVVELKTLPTLTPAELEDKFVEVVADDVIVPLVIGENQVQDGILGLPLSLDTLALYVNRDLLNNKGIAFPPNNWTELQEQVKILTSQNERGEIITSGAALGGSYNLPRFFDILSVLMMQNGTEMVDNSGNVLFNKSQSRYLRDNQGLSGEDALVFFTDFSRPAKEVYTWNQQLPDALEMFVSGKLAFFLGYGYQLPLIKAKAPKLNFTIAPLPQLSSVSSVNFANYWIETVSAKTKNPDWAWDFLLFATDQKNIGSYLVKAKKPTALRALLTAQEQDPDLRIFSRQALTAKSWYKGKNIALAEQAFAEMIDLVVFEEMKAKEALDLAASKVQESYR